MSDPAPETYASEATGMHPLLAKQARYCLACGARLPLTSAKRRYDDERPRCEKCERPFDPEDPATYCPVPLDEPRPWWDNPAVPGAAWLGLYALGNAVVGGLLPTWVYGLGGGDGGVGSAFAGVTAAAMLFVLGFVPWCFACVYLLLMAFEEHLRDEVVWYLTAGGLLGVVSVAGYHPALLLVGLILGVFAALVRQWRMA